MNEPRNKAGLTESEFLAGYKPKDYPRPSVTADILVFAVNDEMDKLKVLLIKRNNHPYINCRALPGGFVNITESCEAAAVRELKEETGLENIYLEQLCTVSEPDRDPRMRVISVAHMALINQNAVAPVAGDDADAAQWFEIEDKADGEVILRSGDETITYHYSDVIIKNGIVEQHIQQVKDEKTELAFDHAQLIHTGLCRLRNKAEYTPILFSLMDEEFTLPELQRLYETVLGKKLYKANFRGQIRKYVESTGKKRTNNGLGRSPELYRYKGESV
jgi:ADP-ribose pyrophosphatase YjhB (NUDIX family)